VAFGALLVSVAGYGMGCSSTTTVNDNGEGGTGEGGTHRDGGSGDDGSGDDDGGGGGTCPGTLPPKADLADPDGGINWVGPTKNSAACSTADLQAFQANLNKTGVQSYDEYVAGLPTTCATCLLSRDTDSHFQVIVATADGKAGFFNFGACYAVAPTG